MAHLGQDTWDIITYPGHDTRDMTHLGHDTPWTRHTWDIITHPGHDTRDMTHPVRDTRDMTYPGRDTPGT